MKGDPSQSNFLSDLEDTKNILEEQIEDNKQPLENFTLFKNTFTELVDEVLKDSVEPYLKLDPTAWKKLTNKKKRKFNKKEIQAGINQKNLEYVRGLTLENVAKDINVIERLTGTIQLEDLSGIEEGFADALAEEDELSLIDNYDYQMEIHTKVAKNLRQDEPNTISYALSQNKILKDNHITIYWPVLDLQDQIEIRAEWVSGKLGIPTLPTIKKTRYIVGAEQINNFRLHLPSKTIKEMKKQLEPLEDKAGETYTIIEPKQEAFEMGQKRKGQLAVEHSNPTTYKQSLSSIFDVIKTIMSKGYDEPLKRLDSVYQYAIKLKLYDTEKTDKTLVDRVADTYSTLDNIPIIDLNSLSDSEKKKLKKPKYPNREYIVEFYSIPENWYILNDREKALETRDKTTGKFAIPKEKIKMVRVYTPKGQSNSELFYVEEKDLYEKNKELFDTGWLKAKEEAVKKYKDAQFDIGSIPNAYRRVFIKGERRKITPSEASILQDYKLLTEKFDETVSGYSFITKEQYEKQDLGGGKYGSRLSDEERILTYIRILGNSDSLSEPTRERLGVIDAYLSSPNAFLTAKKSNLIFPVDYKIEEGIPKNLRDLPITKQEKRIKVSDWLTYLRGDLMISYDEGKLQLEDSPQYYLIRNVVEGEVVGTKTTRTKDKVEGSKASMQLEEVGQFARMANGGKLKAKATIELHTLAELEFNPTKTRGTNKEMKNHINTILNKVQDILDEVGE